MEPRTDHQLARRGILVVDGDAQIRRLLELSLRNAGFDVRTVSTAAEASTAIESERPDLIISEVRLEGGATDGFELCRQIKKRPDGATIAFVLLSEQTVEAKVHGVEAGADDFLAKPVYVQEVVAHARSLLQRRERDRLEAVARSDERFLGDLADFPLVDLLGALEANHKSGVVVMTAAGGARGEIYFREGTVVDAEIGRLSGLDAVCRLFSWSGGRFEIEWKSIRRKDAVGREPGALLMEALRRLDEWRRLLADLPPLETIFEVDYHLLAERLAEIPDEVNAILRLFDGQRTFIHVIDDSGLSDLDALAVIGKLSREEIIRDVRAKPALGAAPGADIEGWLTEAAGPFRAPPPPRRRELFGASPESSAGVHGRPTAPVEPLEEAGREAVVDERRERFTDRLIAEGATAAASSSEPPVRTASRPPVLAPETTQLGLPAAPATPRVPALAPETTQQGLGAPPTMLSTRPGFAAVIPGAPAAAPAPRVARELPEVTPALRKTPIGIGSAADGVPEPLLPQSHEPAIVIPPPVGTTAPRLAAPPPVELAPNELRTVAGEIVSRGSTANVFGTTAAQGSSAPLKRGGTELGLGPGQSESGARADHLREDDRGGRTAVADAVLINPPKGGEAHAVRKIVIDPEVPEDDDEELGARSSRLVRLLVPVLGLGLAAFAVWAAFKSTGHKRHAEDEVAAVSPPEKPVVIPSPAARPPEAKAAVVAAEPGPAVASADAGAPRVAAARAVAARHAAPSAHAAPSPMLDERMADPKVARALPAEFPQLLGACRQAFTEKRGKDAETACLAAKDANPDSAEACALLGHALFNRKKRREALPWAERAVALDPKRADAYVIIGGVKQAAGDAASAKAAYKKYLELEPTGQYAADLRAIVDSL